ncbi:MAG: hypothetical protein HY721_22770 [Planctomycetes bacterium]|nr:hypothetical protein [Planctomycetota bacterium]
MQALDTLGRSKPMLVQTWAWLIGMTDAADPQLLDRARSFARPPSLEVRGARLEAGSHVPERRAIRLIVEKSPIHVTLEPSGPCIDPVFELVGAPAGRLTVTLRGRRLDENEYAWDGQTLWLNASLSESAPLVLELEPDERPPR